MKSSEEWKQYWDQKGEKAALDYTFDRGGTPRAAELEALSEEELVNFIDPHPSEVVFDAGCGTGANMQLLHKKVARLIGMDYVQSAVDRCHRRIEAHHMTNVECFQGSVTSVPLPDKSVDKVLCLSVFQYLNDSEVNAAFSEFNRLLRDKGTIVLHVKNLSSLYHSTLWAGKKIKSLISKRTQIHFFRTFGWYVKTMKAHGFEVVDYSSFNVLMIDKMPRRLVLFLEGIELRNYRNPLFRLGLIRRLGAELKFRAQLTKRV